MTRGVVLSMGVLLGLAGCGNENVHYTYEKSIDCFKTIGTTQVVGSGQNAVRITTDSTKAFDVLFLPSGNRAKNYVKQFKVPSGILRTKGNAIVYGHQTASGINPEVTNDEMSRVEKCLA